MQVWQKRASVCSSSHSLTQMKYNIGSFDLAKWCNVSHLLWIVFIFQRKFYIHVTFNQHIFNIIKMRNLQWWSTRHYSLDVRWASERPQRCLKFSTAYLHKSPCTELGVTSSKKKNHWEQRRHGDSAWQLFKKQKVVQKKSNDGRCSLTFQQVKINLTQFENMFTLSLLTKEVTVSPRHPFTQIHDRNQIF